ncbi:chromate efflux transporter [Pelomonas sp. APW6]|uniref:Chromate efflux transporter n=1 Tax=Roseateles subflavus TaxID=3053353 RepID=A0ABT7LGM6_9BURK|nr:chromate efflux transporter [Pelomonas sp. APW6]MDL5032011.1 chromate efflux transporter [Pelomonas sp. APW6]
MTRPPDPEAIDAPAPAHPRLGEALRYWLKLGCISFGGPAGQIALMHEELVRRRRWISERRFLHALNYCMVLPGPEAQQLATYIGWLLHGTVGGIAAGALFVLPSLALLIGLSWVYMAYGQLDWVAAVFWGVKPAVTALVAHAAWRIGQRTLRNAFLWGVAGLAFVGLAVLKLPFPAIVAGAALLGGGLGRWRPSLVQAGGGHGAQAGGEHRPTVIDDDSPLPPRARFRASRLALQALAAALLWGLPFGLLWAWQGAGGVYTQMAWFFTKAALLTFGGAYAVLPYVTQAAVGHFGWLSSGQVMDGLALGESTPGPLIMVVTFIAFVAGWQSEALQAGWAAVVGHDWAALAAGTVAALLVTWFTFLPSFVFILAGAPLVEATHQDLRITGPLTAITAAVVGVILNLALFFAVHVVWPHGLQAAPDLAALLLTLAAGLALIRFKRGVLEVVGACALLGLAWRLLVL